ncbi:hypothetical protein B0I31_11143 [Saccharothrix carnea]|uniref:Uncharacterized protein n=1 Tax=Saccharothrix carnea TaxID=1280637 RepID=A0A2P8I2S0_SACCR|nr:hypothetical protein B0I31_11143 [Saccharothrix carnea]
MEGDFRLQSQSAENPRTLFEVTSGDARVRRVHSVWLSRPPEHNGTSPRGEVPLWQHGRYSGTLPCLRAGVGRRLSRSMARPRATAERVWDGSMTSSTRPRSAA